MLSIASVQDGDRQYVVLERAEEVRRLDLADLGYFDGALGMSDYPAMFRSWLTSAEPVLLGCLAGNRLLGWCMFEEWDRSDADKTPIHVLRMIEVGAGYRQRNIGRFLTALAAMMAPGHMVTRPLTIASERFFQRLGFIRPPEGAQVDFHDKFGYLLLPTSAKQGLIQTSSRERLILQQEAITHSSNKLK
ncbi:MAG: GNAT family N-acetyltransferase, partial [Chloroflexi bacterium]|nr:GNAT family N-acetyltransferase [Chloroflexota bacterium]